MLIGFTVQAWTTGSSSRRRAWAYASALISPAANRRSRMARALSGDVPDVPVDALAMVSPRGVKRAMPHAMSATRPPHHTTIQIGPNQLPAPIMVLQYPLIIVVTPSVSGGCDCVRCTQHRPGASRNGRASIKVW